MGSWVKLAKHTSHEKAVSQDRSTRGQLNCESLASFVLYCARLHSRSAELGTVMLHKHTHLNGQAGGHCLRSLRFVFLVSYDAISSDLRHVLVRHEVHCLQGHLDSVSGIGFGC